MDTHTHTHTHTHANPDYIRYRASKQANRMLAKAWTQHAGVECVSCHPGIADSSVATGLGFRFGGGDKAGHDGAQTPLHLALAEKVVPGAWYRDSRGPSKCEFCADAEAVERLWQVCEEQARI